MTTPNPGVRPRLAAIQRHLRGVKRRLLWVLVAFGVGSSLTWYFRKTVVLWLLSPAGGQLSETGRPIFTSPTEMFNLTIRLTILGGVVVAFPMLVFHVWHVGMLGGFLPTLELTVDAETWRGVFVRHVPKQDVELGVVVFGIGP